MRSLAACLIVLCLLVIPALADPPMAKLRIEVKTLSGNPVDRASVVVDFGGRSIKKLGRKAITHWETRTNQDGVARIPSVPQGNVRIQVIAKGYQTFGEILEVREEERTVEIRLKPPQPQYSSHE
ncbi:MAG: carboxypeptidase-like regulatory domain-containing protein [Bryobacteraceae bacterium]